MNKAGVFGSILALNGVATPSQSEFASYVVEPIRDYEFNSSIVTAYRVSSTTNPSVFRNIFAYRLLDKLQIAVNDIAKYELSLKDS